jgi:hypothetical protein
VKRLLPLTPEQLAIAEERLRHPAPGGKIAAAKEYGIDLMSLLEQLRLTPEERLCRLEQAANQLNEIRGAALRRRHEL